MTETFTEYDRWMEQQMDRIKELETRIEALEAALRTIRLQNVEPYCREIARAGLDKETSK